MLGEFGRQEFVRQHPLVLRIIPELDDIVMTVFALHQMTLRSTSHTLHVSDGCCRHGLYLLPIFPV
jgi:hypothetical protein